MAASRYKTLVDAMASDIRAGRLAPGVRLPTHRGLAAREGIAVVTATRVYAELEAMGLVSREQGRGTFVRDLAVPAGHGVDQQAVATDAVDLNFNYPSLPGQADLLRQAMREVAASGDLDSLLRYQPHSGRPQDRASIARHLRRRGITADADRILIANGAQHGLAITVMATLSAGDVVAVDALTYPGFKVLAHAFHLDLEPVPTAADGPDLDALEKLCATRPVRAIYTMPTLHNPLGWVMSATDRTRLIGIARKYGPLIIEDASYAYLVEDPPPPLAATAPDITVYVSGLSKSIATGLRVGFVVAPPPAVPSLERAIRATTWNTPALTTAIACRWLDDGTVNRLEAQKRDDAKSRQAIVRQELTDLPLIGHPSSYFTWLPLPEDARADRLTATLARRHISVTTAEPFTTSTHTPQAIRLALGSTDLDTLRSALRTVRRVAVEDACA
ncbi:aminotransferase class I/II-fold pyridoxal phosphate-dependent enzyme [Streptomyces sp. SID486]|uniref:aminotransferase-like domain-containing protein n=1 Tax=Streptomyces sp. SID486 TaxID=2690264 RepID=UPI001367CD5B|nr:PLP-dependent aminotransferase family protein [Streptomyces sp. SID486]MYX94892.1 aminotransferase class I/II-fold pyridoxal phosphate-dependent enzyme [Streptomyces sp. SID486]MYX95442.1 aminotransferase class I/II-fold pyridoxal phosphate-dependent enzyme [Streptomyces sp. SID486]